MSWDKQGYQVIDDDYDDSLRNTTSSTIGNFASTARNSLFGRDFESQPHMETPRETYRTGLAPGSLPTLDEQQSPPHMASSSREETNRWDHVVDLDQSFSHIYRQERGYTCICTRKILALVQFVFCEKRQIDDFIVQNCASQLNPLVVICILSATVYWMFKAVRTTYYLLQMHEIQVFYKTALGINDPELPSHTWNSVLRKLREIQPHFHLSIQSDYLKPIDVYHRILRFKNYFVAFVNHRVLPPVFDIPFLGKTAYLPNGLKYSIKRCLFTGSASPWHGPCLKDDYRDATNETRLTTELEKQVTWFAGVNLLLMPFIFLYLILYTCLHIAEMMKKSPDALSMRRYSNYERYKVRHLNGLSHELVARLNRSPNVIASHIRLMAGALGGLLTILVIWDEDVAQVEHVATVIAGCGGVFLVCTSLIPEETMIYEPEVLLTHVTSEWQYLPAEWKGKAHTEGVRRDFEEIFQLKWMFFLQEITSLIFTPFILYFWMRPSA